MSVRTTGGGTARETRRPDTPFWVEPEAISADRLHLDADESHHLLRVHRAAIGAEFDAVDGRGHLYHCVLESAERNIAAGRIQSRERNAGELPFEIRLLLGMPDPGPVETVVEHAVPLGVTAIDVAVCARSGRETLGEPRLERLRRIARAALKQSRRTRLPEVRSSASLEAAVAALGAAEVRLVADPDGVPRIEPPPSRIQGIVALAVGPPGGFIDWELGVLRGAEFRPISLGPSRLTTETAALALTALARNSLL
ncbi:MAG TPA: RsmE family RNA methyltransferase [Candidatus Eisenbacteria bacterium]|nr:RsmE family RNA methyltransferase [Candidatus Eisenbacteria bacterium]